MPESTESGLAAHQAIATGKSNRRDAIDAEKKANDRILRDRIISLIDYDSRSAKNGESFAKNG